MALSSTYLLEVLEANGTTMRVNDVTGFPEEGLRTARHSLVRIDTEYLWAIATKQDVGDDAGTITLGLRGIDGTAAVAHKVRARVLVSQNPSDFSPDPPGADTELPPYTPIQLTYNDGEHTLTAAEIAAMGNRDHVIVFTIDSDPVILTMEAPSKAQDGLRITVTTVDAGAHQLLSDDLFAFGDSLVAEIDADGTAQGGGVVLMAQNGLWNVISAVNWVAVP